jgi:hypothetical protein
MSRRTRKNRSRKNQFNRKKRTSKGNNKRTYKKRKSKIQGGRKSACWKEGNQWLDEGNTTLLPEREKGMSPAEALNAAKKCNSTPKCKWGIKNEGGEPPVVAREKTRCMKEENAYDYDYLIRRGWTEDQLRAVGIYDYDYLIGRGWTPEELKEVGIID